MNAWALCRWTGSDQPGAYSTVIIRTSLPGMSGSPLVIREVTLGSWAASPPVTAQRQAANPARRSFQTRIVHSSERLVGYTDTVARARPKLDDGISPIAVPGLIPTDTLRSRPGIRSLQRFRSRGL